MDIPQDVQQVIRTIESAGYTAWAVGGCVRDSLLNKKPKDYDVASSCPPEYVCRLFKKCAKTGIKYGTVTVITDTVPVEVTVYRRESGYSDSRHPDSIAFAEDITTDLSRRDFTINAMAWHPERGLCDPFGGKDDIESRVIRAVGDPNVRFDEDALRVLRCLRLASGLDFDVESRTLGAVIKKAPALANISAERVRDELVKLISGSRPELAEVVIQAGGFSHVGIEKISNPKLLRRLPPAKPVRIAGLLWCCLDDRARQTIKKTLSSLRVDNWTIFTVCSLISEMTRPLPKNSVELKKRFSHLPPHEWENLLALRTVLLKEENRYLNEMLAQAAAEPWNRSMLAVSGHDLAKLGIECRDTGRVLKKLLEKVIREPELNDHDTLMNIAAKLKS